MARTTSFSRVLWLLISAWLTACGRVDFDARPIDPTGDLPDAAVADAAAIDAAPAPALQVQSMLLLTTRCGGNPSNTSAQIAVTNTGTADLVINNATLGDGVAVSPFKVTQVPLQIAPGGTGMITVVPPMAVVGTDRGADTFNDKLTLDTNAGMQVIDLVATVIGANIDLQMPAGASSLTFTSSSGCPGSQTVIVKNTGNTAIVLDALVANGVAFAGFTGGTIAAGASKTTTVRPFTTSACAASGTMSYEASSGATTPLCMTTALDVTLDILGSSSCLCS